MSSVPQSNGTRPAALAPHAGTRPAALGPHAGARPAWRRALPVATALGVCAAAVMVYMVDRRPHTAYLLPGWMSWPAARPLFGVLGGSLPSFAHALAFGVATALLPGWRRPATACLLWGGIDTVFEIGQHAAVSGVVVSALPAWCASWPVLDHLGASLLRGRFDPLDLVAIVAGCAAAVALLRLRNGSPAR